MSAINRGRFLPRFPASVQSTGPIITTQAALTYTFSFDMRGLSAETSSIDRADNLALVQNSSTGAFAKITLDDLLSGSQPLDATLTALAALDSSTGLLEQTGADTFAKRSMGTGASTSIPTLADADGRYQPLDTDLTAVAGVASAGLLARTGAGTAEARTITGNSGRVTVTNGNGVSGDPTIDWDGVQVRKNSAGSTFTRRRLNLIEGANIILTVADDSGGDEVDVTVEASGTSLGAVLYTTPQSLTTAEKLQAQTNMGAAPFPITGAAAAGGWSVITAAAGNALTLPAGGQWAWFSVRFTSTGIWAGIPLGTISAGGTTIEASVVNVTPSALVYRITL